MFGNSEKTGKNSKYISRINKVACLYKCIVLNLVKTILIFEFYDSF